MSINHKSACDVSCSLRFALDADNHYIPEAHSELLSTVFGPPSEPQAAALLKDIAEAEKAITLASSHISRLQDALERLVQQRKNLENFANTHRAVLSLLRLLPDEILLEIFRHSCAPTSEPSATATAPWVASRVCRRRRAVSLSSPQLWRRFVLRNSSAEPLSILPQEFPTQLERAGQTLLSINFGATKRIPGALDLFVPVSAQWEEVVVDCDTFSRLSAHKFPALKTLTILRYAHHIEDGSNFSALPSLVRLTLRLNDIPLPRGMSIPWSQLRRFDVHDVNSLDLLWILAQLRQDAQVTVSGGYDPRSAPVHAETTSTLTSLSLIKGFGEFNAAVLDNLIAPAIRKLRITQDSDSRRNPLGEHIARFLHRSRCTLYHLSISANLEEGDLMRVLNSPHLRSLTYLRISHVVLSPPSLAILGSSLPMLRFLILCAGDADKSVLLAALAPHYHCVVVSRDSENSRPPTTGLWVVLS
ncbi:hypothetical protein C8R46DRAFT_1185621 [Mycena filopes]|nr:hypothetical protein C8R46DRAFT_1185621 [Mycena filopes]